MRRPALPSPFALILPVLLAGCGSGTPPPARIPLVRAAAPLPPAQGLGRVMGQDATAVIAALGKPEVDYREGPARKLQFRGAACVLDAYLYAPAAGGAARVTWIDARTPAGDDFDRASCIAALTRRPAAR